jgi:hypothetical protein
MGRCAMSCLISTGGSLGIVQQRGSCDRPDCSPHGHKVHGHFVEATIFLKKGLFWVEAALDLSNGETTWLLLG